MTSLHRGGETGLRLYQDEIEAALLDYDLDASTRSVVEQAYHQCAPVTIGQARSSISWREASGPLLVGPWWNRLGNDEPASLYDLRPLANTLQRLVDFDRLNRGSPRLSVTAVDIQSGEDVAFDTSSCWIGCDEVRASAALIPLFPPFAIGERLRGDAGISVNLPLDIILSEKRDRPLLCIAVDLLPQSGARPCNAGRRRQAGPGPHVRNAKPTRGGGLGGAV
jgi:predicted acylesterase/phospholipase RssA